MTTDSSKTAALLAILQRKLVAPKRLAERAEDHGDPVNLLEELLTPAAAELFPEAEHTPDAQSELDRAHRMIDQWSNEGLEIHSIFDAAYPLNLRTAYDRPALLLVRGSLTPADVNSVAVVGTRKASEAGLARAQLLAAQLTEAGYVIVSGLAEGIDTAAHTGALQAGGRTVAVIGTGHQHAFPKANAALQRRLGDESAVVSQFWPEQGARPWTFPLRNAVMSGLSLATVVVEASMTSGARMQARLALEHGQPVFLLQSLVDEHVWAREMAERPGVYVTGAIGAVVERLERLYPNDLVTAS